MKTVMTVIEDSYFLKVDVQYLEKLLNLHNDYVMNMLYTLKI